MRKAEVRAAAEILRAILARVASGELSASKRVGPGSTVLPPRSKPSPAGGARSLRPSLFGLRLIGSSACSRWVPAIEHLVAGYDQAAVVRGLHLTIGPGELVGLLGPNGAGKTTTLRAFSVIVKPLSGRIVYQGRVLASVDRARAPVSGIAHVPEGRGLFFGLTVAEHFRLPPRTSRRAARRRLHTSTSRRCVSSATAAPAHSRAAISRCSRRRSRSSSARTNSRSRQFVRTGEA